MLAKQFNFLTALLTFFIPYLANAGNETGNGPTQPATVGSLLEHPDRYIYRDVEAFGYLKRSGKQGKFYLYDDNDHSSLNQQQVSPFRLLLLIDTTNADDIDAKCDGAYVTVHGTLVPFSGIAAIKDVVRIAGMESTDDVLICYTRN